MGFSQVSEVSSKLWVFCWKVVNSQLFYLAPGRSVDVLRLKLKGSISALGMSLTNRSWDSKKPFEQPGLSSHSARTSFLSDIAVKTKSSSGYSQMLSSAKGGVNSSSPCSRTWLTPRIPLPLAGTRWLRKKGFYMIAVAQLPGSWTNVSLVVVSLWSGGSLYTPDLYFLATQLLGGGVITLLDGMICNGLLSETVKKHLSQTKEGCGGWSAVPPGSN